MFPATVSRSSRRGFLTYFLFFFSANFLLAFLNIDFANSSGVASIGSISYLDLERDFSFTTSSRFVVFCCFITHNYTLYIQKAS